MSTFSGLSAAVSALYSQRRGLDVTGQNIANANTEGYSRQRVNLQPIGGPTVPAVYFTSDGVGAGVTVQSVDRVQDQFLEARGRVEHGQNGYLADQKQLLARVEQAFGEPSDTGLQSQLSVFWSSWHDLANQPGDIAARTQLLERARTISSTMNSMHATIGSLFASTREQLDAITTEINTTASQVAQLNQAVVRANQAELPINELADRRDKLVLRLSELTGATAVPRDDGSVIVLLNGSSLVNGPVARSLVASGAGRLDDIGVAPVGVQWSDNGVAASFPSGQMASTLESLNTNLPGYSNALDSVATTLHDTVNAQHAAGFDLSGTAGTDFFTGTTAATLALAISDPTKVAAAATAGSAGTGTYDGENASAVGLLATSTTGADRLYRQVVVNLGVATQTVNTRASIQQTITDGIDSARTAQSGVNLDEEMTSLIAYQRGYQAATKVINVVDDMLQSVINLVGR